MMIRDVARDIKTTLTHDERSHEAQNDFQDLLSFLLDVAFRELGGTSGRKRGKRGERKRKRDKKVMH